VTLFPLDEKPGAKELEILYSIY